METSMQTPRIVVIAPPPQKFHPNLAAVAAVAPEIAMAAKGKKKNALARTGVDLGAIGLAAIALKIIDSAHATKNLPKGAAGIAAFALGASAFIANRITGAFDAFQPTTPKMPKVKHPKHPRA